MLVAQSYHVFNRYGKDSEALQDITRSFIEDLNDYSHEQITEAFKSWRRQSAGMPAPANIIEIIKSKKSLQSENRLKSWAEFQNDGKTWDLYLSYLDANGALTPNIENTGRGYSLKKGYIPELYKAKERG